MFANPIISKGIMLIRGITTAQMKIVTSSLLSQSGIEKGRENRLTGNKSQLTITCKLTIQHVKSCLIQKLKGKNETL